MANPQVPTQRIRLALNIATWWAPSLTDLISNGAVQLANGADLQMELFFSEGAPVDGSTVIDFTNIAQVVVSLQSTQDPHNAIVYWTQTIANASINNTCTYSQFITQPYNSANCQVLVTIPNSSNQFNLANNARNSFWLCIYGITNEVTPRQVPYQFFQVQVLDTGMPAGNPTLPQTFKIGSKIPFVCSDGKTRDFTLQPTANGLWTGNVNQAGYNGGGQALYSLLCSDGFYRDISLTLAQGAWTLAINQNGHS